MTPEVKRAIEMVDTVEFIRGHGIVGLFTEASAVSSVGRILAREVERLNREREDLSDECELICPNCCKIDELTKDVERLEEDKTDMAMGFNSTIYDLQKALKWERDERKIREDDIESK